MKNVANIEKMEGESVGRASDKLILRVPDGMRDAIKLMAARNRRTMNSEILILIEAGLRAQEKQNASH